MTLARVICVRLYSTPEGNLELTSEVVWGMIGFATLPTLTSIGTLYAAWQARQPAGSAPWSDVDVDRIGGAP